MDNERDRSPEFTLTPNQPFVAVCTPSRGLIFAEHEEYFENVRDTYPHLRLFRTHNLPIPDCFNQLADEVLQNLKYEYIWWCEEDNVPEPKTLDKFFEAMQVADIACQDYGFNQGFNTIVRSEVDNKILFSGFGCTFMKREVLEAFDKPIFKADQAFNISNLQWYPVDPYKVYGHYDIKFGSEARKLGFKYIQIEGECKHLQLDSLGTKEVNNGCHIISEKGRIQKHLTLPLEDI